MGGLEFFCLAPVVVSPTKPGERLFVGGNAAVVFFLVLCEGRKRGGEGGVGGGGGGGGGGGLVAHNMFGLALVSFRIQRPRVQLVWVGKLQECHVKK